LKILLVEDDRYAAEILLQLLAESHYTIDSALSAQSAWDYITTYPYDLIILDIMLPDSDGLKLCTKLRQSGYITPVLLLTAKDSAGDRVVGLEAGADDYVVKPYNFQELIARIRALLRRDRDTLFQELGWEKLRLDLKNNIVTYDQQPLRLTQKEYGLLEVFLRHPQQIFSRSALIDRVWSAGEFPSEEAVTTHIKTLRQKLKAAGLSVDPIETLYGLGYQLKPEISQPEIRQSVDIPIQSVVSIPVPEDNLVQTNTAQVQEIIAAMAKKLVASLPEKVALLRQVLSALTEGKLDADLRNEGYMEAHRLTGSMGTFGFPLGSTIARQIEGMLKSDFSLLPTDAELLRKLINDLEASTNSTLTTSESSSLIEKPAAEILNPDSEFFSQGRNNRSKVMIVDDDPMLLEVLRHLLESPEIEVITLQNPHDFWQVLELTAPDLLILDLVMPDYSGLDLCKAVRTSSLWHDLPIVFLSAHGDRETIRQLFVAGADDYLNKPIVEIDLYTRIFSRLERSRLSK
jgi:DNA-binding response OmpR family regulator/HPt (histidine-containing phosphotransfer) domain-containing protein